MTTAVPITLIVCGAPLARRSSDIAAALTGIGGDVTTLTTEAARAWLPTTPAAAFRPPSQPKAARPVAVVIAPLTFHTGNALRAGLADTPPRAAACEAIGAGTPIWAVPYVGERLAGHPAWSDTLNWLVDAGVSLIDPATGDAGSGRPIPSGHGEQLAEQFDPAWIARRLVFLALDQML